MTDTRCTEQKPSWEQRISWWSSIIKRLLYVNCVNPLWERRVVPVRFHAQSTHWKLTSGQQTHGSVDTRKKRHGKKSALTEHHFLKNVLWSFWLNLLALVSYCACAALVKDVSCKVSKANSLEDYCCITVGLAFHMFPMKECLVIIQANTLPFQTDYQSPGDIGSFALWLSE